MKKIKLLFTISFLYLSFGLSAQTVIITGKVIGPDNHPIQGAIISLSGAERSAQTDIDGKFKIETGDSQGTITVSAEGFYDLSEPILGRTAVELLLIPRTKWKYNDEIVTPFGTASINDNTSAATNIAKKDLGTGIHLESALQSEVAGLRVTDKSGMPGEGSYMNLRGIRTLNSDNAPLIVINGVPYLGDTKNSPVIGGYSRSILSAYNLNDIQNITVLKGADAAIYGSLGSNGVILIETDGAATDDLETKITFSAQYGMNWNNKRLPVLGVNDYKAYVSDAGMTYYSDMQSLINTYPFLIDDPNYFYKYLYNNNTNWQKEIYSPAFVTDNVFRIEGGDAVAKYDISLGYMHNGGVLANTDQDRYHTQINTDVMISRKLEFLTTFGFAYILGNVQEQGMLEATNPVLAAYKKTPLLSPYKKDEEGNVLDEYDVYRYGVSNPVGIVNTLVAKNKLYDINLRLGLNYALNSNIRFSGIFSLYYNYNQENIFIPGRTYKTVVPLNYNLAENTVRNGVGETKNWYYNLNGSYKNVFDNIHAVNLYAGAQFLMSSKEYDGGSGYNTANDFYQTLDYVESGSESFYGYIDEWNWMNFYAHGDYTWKSLVKTSMNLSIDGSSSSGSDASRFGIFPSGGITLMLKNLKPFIDSPLLNRMDLRIEYGVTGNSRFSSNYGKNYYHSAQFQMLSGIVRSNVPNTHLKWEKNNQLDIGLDMSFLRNRLDLSLNYYNSKSSDIVFAQPVSSVFGPSAYYTNSAEIDNHGIELLLNTALITNKNFEWVIGGNIAIPKSKIVSLGWTEDYLISFDDGAQVITRVGEKPYCYYGYVAKGVFSTSAEAEAAGLSNWKGQPYEAGDVHFSDINDDGIINDKDKQIIGCAAPDYFGGMNMLVRYKNFALSAEFSYSVGNDAYNGVRRSIESMDDLNNQSQSVVRRWQLEGQKTDVPRAFYGDPLGNSAFSTRWIEDASYLKLKTLTLSYSFDKKFLNIFRSGTIYITGENLYTWTNYLGLDPEFSYSYNEAMQGIDYAKVVLPHCVKFGFNLKF